MPTILKFSTLIGLMAGSASIAGGADRSPVVFISSFAGAGKGAIDAFEFDLATGKLTRLHRNEGPENPFFLALAPTGDFLYSIHARNFGGKEDEQIVAYSVEGRTGRLKPLNRQSSRGTASCYLDVDPSGKSVVVANYSSGSVAALPIRGDGSLGEPSSFVQHVGSSVDPARQKEPHAHCMVISPDGGFAYAADLGLDKILCYQLAALEGRLTPNAQPFVRTPPGAGPRHLTFHPAGKGCYVINELSNSITHFRHDPKTGMLFEQKTLSTLPSDFKGTSYCADLKFTPDGKYLYGTNRGHDSLAAYRVADDGELTLIEIVPSRGKGPQNLAVVKGGRWLLCANMPGNNVAVFEIDPASGKLKAAGEPVEIAAPSCLMLLP